MEPDREHQSQVNQNAPIQSPSDDVPQFRIASMRPLHLAIAIASISAIAVVIGTLALVAVGYVDKGRSDDVPRSRIPSANPFR
jgi:hypothetical protein